MCDVLSYIFPHFTLIDRKWSLRILTAKAYGMPDSLSLILCYCMMENVIDNSALDRLRNLSNKHVVTSVLAMIINVFDYGDSPSIVIINI